MLVIDLPSIKLEIGPTQSECSIVTFKDLPENSTKSIPMT